MTLAIITDTVLNKTFNRKTDFMGALNTALSNAGFGSSIDTYDITDAAALAYIGGGTTFNAGNAGSLVGLVKSVVLNAGATQGTVQMPFFTRTAYGSSWGGVAVNTSSTENCFHAGNFTVSGGWNTSTKAPTSSTAGNAIGGYISDYSGCLSQSTSVSGNNTPYTTNSSSASGRLSLGYQYNGYAITSDITHFPYNFTNAIFFKAINHPEIRGVFIQQANRGVTFVGYVRPLTLPSWWNENSYPYCFQPFCGDFLTYRSFYGTLSPFSGATIYSNYRVAAPGAWSLSSSGSPTGHMLGSANTANSSKRDVISAPLLLDSSGIVGKFSSDIVLVNYTGLSQFDRIVVTAGSEEYLVLTPSRVSRLNPAGDSTYGNTLDNSVYGIAIRVV